MASILSFVQCENISGAGLGRLLALINLHLPQPNNFFNSNFKLLKILEHIDEPVEIHYFCSSCYQSRTSESDLCEKCTDESRTVLFFIVFPLEAQMMEKFKRKDFVHDLKYKTRRVKKNDDNIEDIYDGEMYKEFESGTSSEYDISLMWNSDGVQVFKSTSFSLSQFYLVINELPPEKRFLSENLLVAGLWGSVVKPHPNVFLLPIYK